MINRNILRTFFLFICAVVVLGVITACSDSSNSQQSPQTAQEDGNQESSPTMDFKAPLTGLPSSVAIEQRPVMVMVENSPKARPQSGLTQADMVYEIKLKWQSDQPENQVLKTLSR